MTTHYRTCNLCEAMCGLAITVENGRVTGVRGDPDDVFSRGHLCPKGPALRDGLEDPERLRHPVRRTASGWERVSWDEALDETVRRLGETRARHGKNAVGVYVGNPTVHNHGSTLLVPAFLRALGTKNRFDANSQDANPKLLAALLMYGDFTALTVPDVDRTDHLLVLGANPAASNGSLMTLGDVKGRLAGIRERGGRIVLLDPRRTESAAWADEHLFIRPGGDAPLLLALLHVLFTDGRADATVERGGAELAAIARRFPPERVAAAVGIDAPTIRRLAQAFAAAKRPVAYGRVGLCLSPFGALASWLLEALNVACGRFDVAGGMMFARPAADPAALARKLLGTRYARWRSRVRGLPEIGGQLPGAAMAEEMETPGDGQIRAFVTVAGNPVLSTPNGARLARALAGLDFMVSIDWYVNDTTRHAHLILPPVHSLERSHYDLVFHTIAARNTAKYGEPVVPAPPDGKEDWEILYALGMRLGGLRFGNPAVDAAAKLAWRFGWRLSPDRVIDLLLRTGAYRLSLAKLRRAPHGVDLGPLASNRRKKIRTGDGKVDLAPAPLVADLPRLEAWLDEARPELVLIGRRHVRSNNSWLQAKGPRHTDLMVHPDDARRLGIADGQAVRVTSRVGALEVNAQVTDAVMPGVVSLPHGHAKPNVNVLTDEARLDGPSGTAALNGVPVTVEAR